MKETRIAEIRALTPNESGALILEGRAIVFDQPTSINDPAGSYTEIIASGALDEADLSDVRLLFNHDLNRVPLARTPRTMNLSVDPAGMTLRATLPETEAAREVYEAVKRGDLSGMSFAFKVPEGGDYYDPQTNTRTISKIAKVYECSVVPFPAYAQTSVEARSQITEKSKRLGQLRQMRKFINTILER
jgi:HK97 family phage prohead protease